MSGVLGFGVAAIAKAKLVPAWVWKVAGGVVLAIGLFLWHNGAAHKHDKKIIAAEGVRLVARINAVTARITALGTKIALTERNAHEKEVARIHVVTHDLILHGPGKAQCASGSFTSSTSRPKPVAGTADNSVGPMPSPGGVALIAVPFNDFVRVTGQCDINRDEILKWRENRQQIEEINGNNRHDN